MTHPPTAAGKSSFDLIDPALLRQSISLKPGMTALDLACGAGNYLPEMAKLVGPQGTLIAIDLWQEGIDKIRQAGALGCAHIETHVADVGRALPLENQSVDLCLAATVLHDLVRDDVAQAAVAEVARVLKPAGIFSVVEFKKQDGPPGPPKQIRLRLEEVSMLLLPARFIRFGPVVEIGRDLWFAEFKRLAPRR